jgi:hypothetical protein
MLYSNSFVFVIDVILSIPLATFPNPQRVASLDGEANHASRAGSQETNLQPADHRRHPTRLYNLMKSAVFVAVSDSCPQGLKVVLRRSSTLRGCCESFVRSVMHGVVPNHVSRSSGLDRKRLAHSGAPAPLGRCNRPERPA